jgi:hypothetical protein
MEYYPITREQLCKMKEEYENIQKKQNIQQYVIDVRNSVIRGARVGLPSISLPLTEKVLTYSVEIQSILVGIFLDCTVLVDAEKKVTRIGWC